MRTRFRPVPLRWTFCYAASGPRAPGTMTDLLDSAGRGLNPKLNMERFIKAEARWGRLFGCLGFSSGC